MDSILRKHIFIFIICIAGCVVMLVGVGLLVRAMNTKMSHVVQIKQRLASYQKNKKAFAEEASQLRVLEGRVAALESKVVTSETVPLLLSDLESLATKSAATFEITSVQTPLENNKAKLIIDGTITGGYAQVQGFLEQLQHQAYIVIFKKLNLSVVPESASGSAPTPTVGVVQLQKEPQWQGVVTLEVVSY